MMNDQIRAYFLNNKIMTRINKAESNSLCLHTNLLPCLTHSPDTQPVAVQSFGS